MPEYLATVRGADGRTVTENVVAGSADEAVRLLRARGCEEIVLHNDDIMALLTRQRAVAEHVSTRDYLRLRNLPPGLGLFVVVTLGSYRTAWAGMVSVALALAALRLTGHSWGLWDWLCVGVLLFPPVLAAGAVLAAAPTRARFRKMLDALYWGRWEECLRRADRLGPKFPAREVAVHKAKALAGLDRLGEALALVEPYADDPATPGWFYHAMLAQVHEFARRRDEAIAQYERAAELAPDNATTVMTLARLVLWHRRDARRARELLRQARSHALSDMTAPFADMLEGLILLEEGRPRDALPILQAAYEAFHARRHMPLGYLPREQAMLGLALAHAALGDRDEAMALYRQVRPRLVALRSGVVDRCDRAIGG